MELIPTRERHGPEPDGGMTTHADQHSHVGADGLSLGELLNVVRDVVAGKRLKEPLAAQPCC